VDAGHRASRVVAPTGADGDRSRTSAMHNDDNDNTNTISNIDVLLRLVLGTWSTMPRFPFFVCKSPTLNPANLCMLRVSCA
jgi:hypothetical protein